MAHILYSTEYERNRDLFYNIKKKHDLDAASPDGSVLQTFLDDQAIILADDKTIIDASDASHILFTKFEKDSEKFNEQRRKLFGKPLSNVRECAQNLKSIKRGKVHELGDWGLTIVGDNAIDYPSEFEEIKEVVKTFINKHLSFPAGSSPIQTFLDNHPDIDLTADLADVALAEAAQDNFKAANASKEIHREQRDTKWELVEPHVEGIGQNLMSIFDKTPKKLGDWGFTVDMSKAKPKEKTLSVGPEAARTIYDAIKGTVVKLSGPSGAKVYRGKSTDGTPLELPVNGTFVIKTGYGTFTIVNDNPTEEIKINVTVRK